MLRQTGRFPSQGSNAPRPLIAIHDAFTMARTSKLSITSTMWMRVMYPRIAA